MGAGACWAAPLAIQLSEDVPEATVERWPKTWAPALHVTPGYWLWLGLALGCGGHWEVNQ